MIDPMAELNKRIEGKRETDRRNTLTLPAAVGLAGSLLGSVVPTYITMEVYERLVSNETTLDNRAVFMMESKERDLLHSREIELLKVQSAVTQERIKLMNAQLSALRK